MTTHIPLRIIGQSLNVEWTWFPEVRATREQPGEPAEFILDNVEDMQGEQVTLTKEERRCVIDYIIDDHEERKATEDIET